MTENSVKKMYDARDAIGVHLSQEGASELYDGFAAFFHHGESDELLPDKTPICDRKRKACFSSSDTTPSAGRVTKVGRNDGD